MEAAVERLIKAGDRDTLARELHNRKYASVPGCVKTGWAFYAAEHGKAAFPCAAA